MSTALHLLILEDDPYDAELEVSTLEEAGYVCQWERVETRAEFLACLDAPGYDLILADYSLPTFDGLTALKLLLERDLDLPFILISGTLGEETAIESLKAGATDYVLKGRLSRLGPVVQRALREKEEHQQRKWAEKALRESEEKYKTLVEDAPLGIYYSDFAGTFLYGNRKAEEIVGYKREELIGKSYLQLRLLDLKGIGKAIKLLAQNRLGRVTGPDEFILNRKDGTRRTVEIRTRVITIGGK